MTATLAETAAEYARRGIAVLALHPARKEPAGEVCPHGNDDATTDTDQVRAWWEHNPDYNIGIRPPPGYIVLDVDPRNGGGLDQLGAVPPTSIAKTGGGGWHLWFHYRGAVRGNLDGDRSSGVDIKSNSGYLVAPPSIHDVTGNRYRWISTGPIAPLPKHLVPRVAIPATTTPAAPAGTGTVAPGAAAAHRATMNHASNPPHARNGIRGGQRTRLMGARMVERGRKATGNPGTTGRLTVPGSSRPPASPEISYRSAAVPAASRDTVTEPAFRLAPAVFCVRARATSRRRFPLRRRAASCQRSPARKSPTRPVCSI